MYPIENMANNEVEEMIMETSFDDEDFFYEALAVMPQSIRHITEDNSSKGIIPEPNISPKIFLKAIEYCNKHVAADISNPRKSNEELKKLEELNKWDEKFLDIDLASLYEIILAANYLNIKGLLNVAWKKVFNMIGGKSPEEIRWIFDIGKDFTPEEEEKIRRENEWAFERIVNCYLQQNNMSSTS